MKVGKLTAIALGTNLGDRMKNLLSAAARIGEDCLTEMKVSSVYETEPWGITDQPKFLNAVVVGQSDWNPPALLHFMKGLEAEMGRTAGVPNGPRLIDLDLLAWGEATWESESLVVPHPRLTEREFVLAPLNELWPEWVHPVRRQTARELFGSLGENQRLSAKVFAAPPPSTMTP